MRGKERRVERQGMIGRGGEKNGEGGQTKRREKQEGRVRKGRNMNDICIYKM